MTTSLTPTRRFARAAIAGVAAAGLVLGGSAGLAGAADGGSPDGGRPPKHAKQHGARPVITNQSIVEAAEALVGVPYKWGGKSPDSGLDCSGLVSIACQGAAAHQVPKDAGTLGGAASIYAYGTGTHISMPSGNPLRNAVPGDVLFFTEPGARSITHTGIYALVRPDGGHTDGGLVAGMIHAPHSGTSVTAQPLGTWAAKLTGILRFGTTDAGSTPQAHHATATTDSGTPSSSPGTSGASPDAGTHPGTGWDRGALDGGNRGGSTDNSSSGGVHGTVTTPGADGGSITYNGATGLTTTTHPDGTSETETPGTTVTQNDDGSMDISYPDGTTAHVNSDNSQDVTYPDGSTEHIDADGTSSSDASNDGGYVDPEYVAPSGGLDEDALRLAITIVFSDSTGPGVADPVPEDVQPEVPEFDSSRLPFAGLLDPVEDQVSEAVGSLRPRIGGPDCIETGCGQELDLSDPPTDPNDPTPFARGVGG